MKVIPHPPPPRKIYRTISVQMASLIVKFLYSVCELSYSIGYLCTVAINAPRCSRDASICCRSRRQINCRVCTPYLRSWWNPVKTNWIIPTIYNLSICAGRTVCLPFFHLRVLKSEIITPIIHFTGNISWDFAPFRDLLKYYAIYSLTIIFLWVRIRTVKICGPACLLRYGIILLTE